jgi:tetratricopeptide (TPR) repeat protein
MGYWRWTALTLVLVAIPALSQNQINREQDNGDRLATSVMYRTNSASEESGAIKLLKAAETETAGLEIRMRAWALWQIGIAYQANNRAKALDLFQSALTASRSVREDGPSKASTNDPLARITGRQSLSPLLQLQADIARSIVRLDPARADQVLQQIAPSTRSAVLASLLVHQEKEKHFDKALEILSRITAQDEMPYGYAMRLIDNFKAEQTDELLQLFSAALVSYRDHAPHVQFRDEFPVMVSRYWKRLPKEVVQQAIDEILKQASDSKQEISYSIPSDRGTTTANSLYEFRLAQMIPMLREFDPSAARRYVEKYPALESANAPFDLAQPAAQSTTFRSSHDYNSMLVSGLDMPLAQKAAAQVDAGNTDDAMSQASNITDGSLRAQTYEYIARATAKNDKNAATKAIRAMLNAADKLQPSQGFVYYASAAAIYTQMDETEDAKKSIEAGLSVARKLYKDDSDDDDPNTALQAFWPSTNAFCTIMREAAHVSSTWAVSLLQDIKDPGLRVAAEIALAAGWLDAPIGPSTTMTVKKNKNALYLGTRE